MKRNANSSEQVFDFGRSGHCTMIAFKILVRFCCWLVVLVGATWSPEVPMKTSGKMHRRLVDMPEMLSGRDGSGIFQNAVEEGVRDAENLFNVVEPFLVEKGYVLGADDPAYYLNLFSRLKPEGQTAARKAIHSVRATAILSKRFELHPDQITFGLQDVDVTSTSLGRDCPLLLQELERSVCSNRSDIYRTEDGSCNNRRHRHWGQSLSGYRRLLPPDYADGYWEPRIARSGHRLPSARLVSSTLGQGKNRPSQQATLMLMQWGQFTDHDLTRGALTLGFNGTGIRCCGVPRFFLHPACFPIEVPQQDPFYRRFNFSCLEFVRSTPSPRERCALGPLEQVNQVTSFLDGSVIYGCSPEDSELLRSGSGGRLKESYFGFRKSLLPTGNDHSAGDCEKHSDNLLCFVAGDLRANEQPALTAIHTVWLREHNRLAALLARINPHWNDERLYQESRRIVVAMLQHITFNEFLPLLLGDTVVGIFDLSLRQDGGYYEGYDPDVDPTITNVFSTAAFRVGHSLVQNAFLRYSKKHQPISQAPRREIALHSELFQPATLYNFGSTDRLLMGLVNQESQDVDLQLSLELGNRLFQRDPRQAGTDLFAINIQRGRDHGLPGYTAWRELCGLKAIHAFPDLAGLMEESTILRLSQLYRDVGDIDLYPAGLAEFPVTEGMVGPTFSCLIARQFEILRKGDRFWYENGGFSSSFSFAQLNELRKTTLARVLCDNLDDVETLQLRVMEKTKRRINPRVKCTNPVLPRVDLSKWKEWKRNL